MRKASRRDRAGVALALACWLACGFALVLAYNGRSHAQPRETAISEVVAPSPPVVPDVASSIRPDAWPNWLPSSNKGSRAKSVAQTQPVIAIVIDDLGADVVHTKEATALASGVTLSFLPYPANSQALSHKAHLAGHEVMVHLPMQPVGRENPGPMALTSNLAEDEIVSRVNWALNRVSDYTGVNNHMGSSFTTSRKSLEPVMQELAMRRLFFLDSRTTPLSQAEETARAAGLLTGARDVFLDDDERAVAVEAQLKLALERARTHGSAIAIGHPHAETLAVLKAWLARLSEQSIRLVPVSEVLELRAKREHGRVASLGTQ